MASVRKREWSASQVRKPGGRKTGVSWEVSWHDGVKRRRKAGFATKGEAEAFATERQKEANDGVSRSAGYGKTVENVCEEFLAHNSVRLQRKIIGPGHYSNTHACIRNYICRKEEILKLKGRGRSPRKFSGGLGHLLLPDVRPSTVEKFRDALMASGLGTGAVKHVLLVLHQVFDFSRKRDYLAVNPVDKIRVEKPRDQRNERVYPPSRDEIIAILQNSSGTFRLAVELSACTGIRAGELRALRYHHIDPLQRSLSVDCALDVENQEGPPKSEVGFRTIPLSAELVARIEHHRQEAELCGPNDLVFPFNQKGAYYPQKAFLYRLHKIQDSLKVSAQARPMMSRRRAKEQFTWHSLRHYAISSWIAEGLGLKAVQTFAGHADVGTTWNRYGHLFPAEDHWEKITKASALILHREH